MRVQIPGEADRRAGEEALAWAVEERLAERVRERDATLWPGRPAEWLGWIDAPLRMQAEVETLQAFAAEQRAAGLTDAVLLGMGGSSLAPEVLARTVGPVHGGLRLHVLDSTHPDAVAAVRDRLDPERTLVVVASKSGTTLEVVALDALFAQWLPDAGRFAAITDPNSPLEGLARERGFGRVFPGDPEIGGRYSALSPFGLLPAALLGIDLDALLERARGVRVDESVELGALLGALADAGRDKLTLLIEERFSSLGLWIEQLVAESSGKEGRGILPVAAEPAADPEAYGEDRVFVAMGATDSERLRALVAAGHPVVELGLEDPLDVAAAFLGWELATAAACARLGVNAFDQPNVQEAKDATKATIAEWAAAGGAPPPPAAGVDAEALRGLLDAIPARGYLAVLAYLPYDERVDGALARLRGAVLDARALATTAGYGPRYLHSTGQLHKGGPPVGGFLVVTGDAAADLEVPGAGYSFDALVRAQATGDLRALEDRRLPVLHVHLAGDPGEGMDALARAAAAVA